MLNIWLLVIILAIIVIYFIATYNRFITLRERIDNAWSQIEVQLKRRYDLIPNLVETVKGYAKHERAVFNEITAARTAVAGAKSVKEKAKAESQLSAALKTLFAVVENYPKLKANENFMMLQEELTGTENKIAYSRQFYNDTVMIYNAAIQRFPAKIVASISNFKERELFKAEEKEAAPVKVSF